jgi:carbon-monoxide dehydrogenase large subunit
VPNIRVFLMEEEPSPINPLGAKGAGEGGIIPVGGVIANAVASALQQFGVRPHDLPLSPLNVWQLIQSGREIKAAE